MLFNLMDYSAIYSKSTAMKSNLLNSDDYLKLLNMKKDREVFSFLIRKNKSLELLKNDEDEIELLLKKTLICDFNKIKHYTKKESDKIFLDSYFLKFELDILKEIIEALFSEQKNLKKYQVLSDNFDFLENIDQIQSLNDLLKFTNKKSYHSVLERNIKRNASVSEISTALDIYYYNLIFKVVEKQFKNEKEIKELFLNKIDLYNIFSLNRIKKYFNIDIDLIFTRLIPIYGKVSQKTMQEMVEAQDYKSFQSLAKNTYYAKELFSSEKSEQMIKHDFLKKSYKDKIRRLNYSILPFLDYIYAKECEIENIVTILEGIKYNYDEKYLMTYLYL